MSRPIIRIVSIVAILTLAVASWWFIGRSNMQKELVQDANLLETGIALFKENKYPEALVIFENYPTGTEQEWYARYYQGSTYIMLKDYQPAITFLEQALALNPTETQIMHALGVTYYKLGKSKISKAYFASALEIDPEDAEARGLMEIMANLERQKPANTEPEPEPEPEEKINN